MARLVDLGGSPVNLSERETVKRLVDELPKGWSVIPNASMPDPRTGHPYEYDAIVVGPHAIYVIEVKGWRGTIRQLGQSDWQLEGGVIERNPLPLADMKARVLASHLKKTFSKGRAPYVQACLVCGSDDASFEVYGMDGRRCLRPSELVPYLRDPSQLYSHHAPGDHRADHEKLVQAITGSLEARKTVGRRYGSYLTTSLQERDESRAIWLGKHALLDDGRVVRIRAWYLSAYQYDEKQRRVELDRLMRAATALSKVGEHPRIATLRDFGEHDGEFYEVTDWSAHGTLATAFVRGTLGKMSEAGRIGVLRDLAEALEAARQQGVFHRALSPEAVLLEASGRVRLTGFDLAFVEGARGGTVYGMAPHPHAEFLPPELRNPGDHEVFDNSDLYSLAKMARFLFGDSWPEPIGSLLERCLAEEPGDRPENPMAFLRELEPPSQPALPFAAPQQPSVAKEETDDASEAVPGHFAPGEVIDGVNLVLGELGRGAGAVVYRVANEPLAAELALKLVLHPPEGYDAAAEYRLLRAVNSPHVPRAHWLGRLSLPDGTLRSYLLLDLVDGERLSSVIARGVVPVEQALRWTDDLLEALDALHAAGGTGVLHRDVKPTNVMVGPKGAVLVDFGSAREATNAGAAAEGTLRATPPDLASTGWQPQADVFAAAAVGYELLSGRPPWLGAPTADLVPPQLDALRSEVPASVAAVFARALASRAADRFPSAAALRQALAEAKAPPSKPSIPAARPGPEAQTRLTTLAAAVEEAGDALWTARRVQALSRHPDLAVPLAQALQACVVPPVETTAEAGRDALLASEAMAAALEAPLPEAMPRMYDALLAGLLPSPLDSSEDSETNAERLSVEEGDRALWIDALHFTEWPLVLETAQALGRHAALWAWAAAPNAGTLSAFDSELPATIARLSPGDRASVDLGALVVSRRNALQEALLSALEEPGRLWVGAPAGVVYLGHGLRRDVGEGLDERADVARAAWAAAFPSGRAGAAGEPLPCRVRQPVREAAGQRYPVGRLAWPDPAGTPWLQTGGLSLPERVLLLFRLDP